MRLLILTQKADINDPILGFFHGWIIELAKHFDSLVVICLGEGSHEFSLSTKVLSLGKETRSSKVWYLFKFYKYIWNERKNYDAVLVHMNQEYVILGGLFWKVMKKKVYLWRNHPRGNMLTRIAVFLSNKVFCTSTRSFTARFSKTSIMPVGINTELFVRKPEIAIRKNSILYIGRISPIKNIEMVIRALADLKDVNVKLTIVGNTGRFADNYLDDLKSLTKELGVADSVIFKPAVTNENAVYEYNSNEIFVNATPMGSLDKTIFEALACGAIVVSRSSPFTVDKRQCFNNSTDLAESLRTLLLLPEEKKEQIRRAEREYVIENHSLELLGRKLFESMNSNV